MHFYLFFLLEGKSDVLVKGLMALRGQVLVLPAFALLAASNLFCLLRCAPRLHSSTFCGDPRDTQLEVVVEAPAQAEQQNGYLFFALPGWG